MSSVTWATVTTAMDGRVAGQYMRHEPDPYDRREVAPAIADSGRHLLTTADQEFSGSRPESVSFLGEELAGGAARAGAARGESPGEQDLSAAERGDRLRPEPFLAAAGVAVGAMRAPCTFVKPVRTFRWTVGIVEIIAGA